jgi:hypothetical protein
VDESCRAAEDSLDVGYLRTDLELLVGLAQASTYCGQDLSFQCTGETISLEELQGWYDNAGEYHAFTDTNIGELLLC